MYRKSSSYRNSSHCHHSLGLPNSILAEVEDAGGEGGVGFADEDGVGEVFRLAGAAAGDDGDRDGVADRAGDFKVVAVLGAVGVHAGEDDFAGAEGVDFTRPGDGLSARRDSAAVDVDFPDLSAVALDALRVDIHYDALAAEAAGGGADELGIAAGGRVDRNLVATGVEQGANVVERTDSAADGERHEDNLGRPADDVEHDVAAFVAGRDVEEDQLVGPFLLVTGGHGDGIAGVAEIDEVRPFHDAAAVHVQAGNDAFGEHEGETTEGKPPAPRLVQVRPPDETPLRPNGSILDRGREMIGPKGIASS